ncbi:Imm6 family immunity protein [Metabacillus niabensis]|uniref:Imm6 family immunity protein n=1 Tax=Metabacillus niabensis TaxID=324854 RepID=UPI0035213527
MCLGNALAYTISEAYRYEGEKFLPQTIESVDDDTVDSFLSNFNGLSDNHHRIAQKLLHVLQVNYLKTSDGKVDINLMRNLAMYKIMHEP